MRRLFTSLKTTVIKPQKSILHINGCVLVKIILFFMFDSVGGRGVVLELQIKLTNDKTSTGNHGSGP